MKNLFLLFLTLLCFLSSAQKKNIIGVQGGISNFYSDGFSNGYLAEVIYKRNVYKKIDFGIKLSTASRNSFPSFFQPSFDVTNGVPLVVDDYILNQLPPSDAFILDWEHISSNYIHAEISYSGINLLGFTIEPHLGLFYQHQKTTSFGLKGFTSNSIDGIISYDPRYIIASESSFGWSMGVALKKQIAKDYFAQLYAGYYLPFTENSYVVEIIAYTIGIHKRF